VKEKLDIMYDLTDLANKQVDGIDVNNATMLFNTVLLRHQYFLPRNELRTHVDRIFNSGEF